MSAGRFLVGRQDMQPTAAATDDTFRLHAPDRVPLKRYETKIDINSEAFAANYASMEKLVKNLDATQEKWAFQGKPRRVQQQYKRGKLLARQRLDLCLDQDSPFLEIMPLVGMASKDGLDGNPMVGGIGLVSGVECMMVVNSPTVGRGMTPATGMKFRRFWEISLENRLPFISLLESPGADLSRQFEVFHGRPMAFYSLARLSKDRIPSVAVVFGTCIAGGAYFAGMSDYTIMVNGNAQLALAGSKLVKMATNEVSTDEELGGAQMHSKVSGSSEYLVSSEYEAIAKCRELVATFHCAKPGANFPNSQPFLPRELAAYNEPYYNPDELLGIASGKMGHSSFDCREVMCRIVDGSEMFEFKPEYAPSIACVWANIYGVPVGILGNNGVIFPDTAKKATHFINLCNQRGYPIIYLHNVTGFMVGQQYERAGMLKYGAQMINAMSNVEVPCMSVMIGSSFGAANYAMCGTGYYPRFLFSWPNAECAVMGPDQLSGVLELLAREKLQKAKIEPNAETEKKIQATTQVMRSRVQKEMNPMHYSSFGIDDGVIDPRDTRAVLGICLSAVCNRHIEKGFVKGLSRM